MKKIFLTAIIVMSVISLSACTNTTTQNTQTDKQDNTAEIQQNKQEIQNNTEEPPENGEFINNVTHRDGIKAKTKETYSNGKIINNEVVLTLPNGTTEKYTETYKYIDDKTTEKTTISQDGKKTVSTVKRVSDNKEIATIYKELPHKLIVKRTEETIYNPDGTRTITTTYEDGQKETITR